MDATIGDCVTADGRRIAWIEHGAANGVPVLYCHGAPGAPAEIEQFHGAELAQRLGVRMLVVARPGIWLSDALPGRRIRDWAADALMVADACGAPTFGVLGYSAGAAYAAAVATSAPDRVRAVAMVAPVDHGDPSASAQLDRLSLWAERQTLVRPRLTRAVMRATLATPLWRPALRLVLDHSPLLRRPDHLALRDRTVRESIVRKADQAFVAGVSGPQIDMGLMMQPWGIDPGSITSPVAIWQGTQDTLGATVAMAEGLHRRIAGSSLTLVDGGHLSTMTDHAPSILAWIANVAAGTVAGGDERRGARLDQQSPEPR